MSDHYLDRGIPPAAIMHVAPITAMATAAAVTTTLRVGCRVFCIDYHVPASLAKEAATLDMLSEGRLEFGIGAGWSAHEYASMGLAFDGAPQRVAKLAEVVALLKAHWSGEVMNLAGEYVNVAGYAGLPLPVQKPNPPLMIGGGKQRVLSLAAREADIVSISNVPFLAVNDAGLDPMGVRQLRDTVLRLNADLGMTVFMNTHLLSEVAKVCTSIGVLNHGELIYNDSIEATTQRFPDEASLEDIYVKVGGASPA